MTSYTITGAGELPDDATALPGTWYITLASGYALDAGTGFRAGTQTVVTSETDGTGSVTLPGTTGDQVYLAYFQSRNRAVRLPAVGTYAFTLTANMTWDQIIDTPTVPPLTPSLVSQAQASATSAASSASAAAASAATAHDISNIDTSDDVVDALLNDSGSASRGTLNAAFARLPATTDLILHVSTTGNDASNGRSWGSALATLDEALTRANAAGGGFIELGGGEHTPPTVGIGSNVAIRGRGRGVTIIKAPAGYTSSILTNVTRRPADPVGPTTPNPNIGIFDLTVDGNLANQSGTNVGLSGIDFFNTPHLVLCNVESRNVDGKGIFLQGPGGGNVDETLENYGAILTGVTTHGNHSDGIWVGFGFRQVQWLGVWSYHNGNDGAVIDVSESQVSSLVTYGNQRDGIYIRNVFAGRFTGLNANRNGRHGIHVQGMTYSVGSDWNAHNNGQGSTPNGVPGGLSDFTHVLWDAGYNVWFDSDASMSYGISKGFSVHGIDCSHIAAWFDTTPTEDYCLWIDDGINNNVTIDGIELNAAGISGSMRQPAIVTGEQLVLMGHPGATNNVNLYRGNLYLANGGVRNPDTLGIPATTVTTAAGNGTTPPAPTMQRASGERGIVNFGSGTTPAAGDQITVAYNKTYPTVQTPIPFIQALNLATAQAGPYVSSVTTTGFTIAFANAPAASKTVGTYSIGFRIVIPSTTA